MAHERGLKKLSLLFLSVIVITVILLVALSTVFEPPTKSEWFSGASSRLKKFQLPKAKSSLLVKCDNLPYGEFYTWNFQTPEGVVVLDNSEWVAIESHSIHELESANRFLTMTYRVLFNGGRERHHVGDAVLALDSRGRFFVNDGHVCGRLQILADRPVKNLDDFFSYAYLYSGKKKLWKPFKQYP